MINLEGLAQSMYEGYCESVGWKSFNGDTLPQWVEFYNDPKKEIQSKAWIAAAQSAIDYLDLK